MNDPRPLDIAKTSTIRTPQIQKTSASVKGELVYVVGDVHGCYGQHLRLLEEVAADAERRARDRRPVLIFLGDYVDRGPRSSEVLSSLVWLSRHGGMELRCLKGNHEEMMLAFLDRPVRSRSWLDFGGVETLRSYGVSAPGEADPDERCWGARDELLDRMPAAHLHFLRGLELSVQIGDYAFVHAGVRPGVALDKQSENDLLWIREGFLTHERPFGKIVVHGHSWTSDQPQIHANRIGLDTGVYETGVLTAMRLEDREMEIIQVGA